MGAFGNSMYSNEATAPLRKRRGNIKFAEQCSCEVLLSFLVMNGRLIFAISISGEFNSLPTVEEHGGGIGSIAVRGVPPTLRDTARFTSTGGIGGHRFSPEKKEWGIQECGPLYFFFLTVSFWIKNGCVYLCSSRAILRDYSRKDRPGAL